MYGVSLGTTIKNRSTIVAKILVDLTVFSNSDLLTLRDQINEKLKDLGSIDLVTELVGQFTRTKAILEEIEDDHDVEPQKKAAIINACSSMLKQLTAAQKELYSTERVKKIERAIIVSIKDLPVKNRQRFLDEYEEALLNG